MMMATALLAGGSIYAQTKSDANTGATKTQNEQCCNQASKDSKDAKKGKKSNKGDRGNRPAFNPFDGVQLTPDQQQSLQVLQQGIGPVVLDKEQQEKIKENPNLTPEQKKQLKEERNAKKLEAKKNYLSGVKEILTPDQYVIFLENVYLYSPQNQGPQKGMKPGKPAGNHAKKGPKGEKKGGERKAANQ